jgi:hypothetical protein
VKRHQKNLGTPGLQWSFLMKNEEKAAGWG